MENNDNTIIVPEASKPNSRQGDKKRRQKADTPANVKDYSEADLKQFLQQKASQPFVEKKPSIKDRLTAIKDDIAAVYPSRMTAPELVKAMEAHGLKMTVKTFKTYWWEIQAEEKKPAPISEGKTTAFSENSCGENPAGSEPENVQKPATVLEDRPPVNSVECPGKNAECGKELIPEKYKVAGPNFGRWHVSCECGHSDFL